jgi:phenylacetate-CoA ligase
LLKHAYETVPYYRKAFRMRHLSPEDVKSIVDLNKLPQLTKEDVQNRRRELLSTACDRRSLMPYQSGGTGNPIKFFITKDSYSWEIAAEFRAYGWAGYELGDRCFMFWGSPIDLSRAESLVRRINHRLERVLIAGTYVLSDRVFEKFAQMLRRFHPKIIRGYASSVALMARYLNDKQICDIRPKAVITAAETLQKPMRKEIEKAFDCPVFDYYGSREIGAIASECQEHVGYHISAENVVVEFVEENEPVSADERGLMLVTDLRNFGMPFIRYKIGDVGKPSKDLCPCGRGLPLMSSIEGRVSDFMASYDETRKRVIPVGPIYPVIITAAMHLPIENFQAVQDDIDSIRVKVVRSEGYTQEHTDYMVKYIHEQLGSSLKIEIEFVDSIPPLPSGKRSVFLSKIDPFQVSSEARDI